jgi:hypothetical protein
MRIISKFRDYYDSVQRQGMDKDVVYVRETKDISLNIKYEFSYSYRSSFRYRPEGYLLGYCGKIYHVFEIQDDDKKTSEFFYDYEEFKARGFELGIFKPSDFKYRWWRNSFDIFYDQNTRSALEFFHKYQVPLFLISRSDERSVKSFLKLNPSLKKLDFQTVKDPYTAYQDIFQFVSGVLNSRENDTVEISDKDKIQKHGFDKWSFRKLPSKKK